MIYDLYICVTAFVDAEFRHVYQERPDYTTLQPDNSLTYLKTAKDVFFIVLEQHGLSHSIDICSMLEIETDRAVCISQGRHGNLRRMLIQDNHGLAKFPDLSESNFHNTLSTE